MNKITNQFASIEQVTDRYLNRKSTETAAQENSVSFEDILRQKQTTAESQELRFSKHAQGRLNDRHINLSDEQNERLESGVLKASEKGIRDSLAFIVNVPSKTVVTAMDQSESESNIFTNIDGAVIV